jgi:hypothetical protein
MRPRDTPPESHRVMIEAFRRMPPGQRSGMAVEITNEVRKMAVAGVRRRHPDYDDRKVSQALLRLYYGDEVALRVWPGDPLVEP